MSGYFINGTCVSGSCMAYEQAYKNITELELFLISPQGILIVIIIGLFICNLALLSAILLILELNKSGGKNDKKEK